MDNLERIFKSKLAESKINNHVPIACSIMNLYESMLFTKKIIIIY